MSGNNKGNIGSSTNLIIGGKSYNSQDISKFKLKEKEVHTVTSNEYKPRDISKEVVNQANTIHTISNKSSDLESTNNNVNRVNNTIKEK